MIKGCSPLGAQLAVGDELIEDVEGALAYNEKGGVCVGGGAGCMEVVEGVGG